MKLTDWKYLQVTTSIYNLILGKLYCDHYGTMRIQGNREYSCKLKFKEQSIIDRNPHQVIIIFFSLILWFYFVSMSGFSPSFFLQCIPLQFVFFLNNFVQKIAWELVLKALGTVVCRISLEIISSA